MSTLRNLSSFLLVASLGFLGCAAETDDASDDGTPGDDDAREVSEENLTQSEKAARCAKVKKSRPFTTSESAKLLELIVAKSAKAKLDNDAKIRERGIGIRMGNRSGVYRLLFDELKDPVTKLKYTPAERAARKEEAVKAVRKRLKPGFNAEAVVAELRGTSCIGFVYEILRSSYAELGRSEEWATVETCGRAWDSDGLHVQQALIATGWPSPSLPFISDEANTIGSALEKEMLTGFKRAINKGVYYGTPLSKTTVLKNFAPMPGATTRSNLDMLIDIGSGNSFGVGTFRGAYHVPLIVPAATIPAALVSGVYGKYKPAQTRGEAFMIESHASRQPWDASNLEIRPLSDAIVETYAPFVDRNATPAQRESAIVYSTGNILFAPNADFEVTP
jgi:hypothetical protein